MLACSEAEVSTDGERSVEQNMVPVMLELFKTSKSASEDNAANSDGISDDSITFWVPYGAAGLYHICWNPEVARNTDPSAYSESLGTLEILPLLAIIGEFRHCYVVCA